MSVRDWVSRRAGGVQRAVLLGSVVALWVCTPARARVGNVVFITFNTWNVNEPFQSRIDNAIEQLRTESPDVLGLEEIYLEGDGVAFRTDERIASALHLDRVSHAAATVPLGSGTATEGLSLLSRYPIVSSTFLQLPSPNGGNGRIVLQGTISTPFGLIDCYVTHLSTNSNERDQQAQAAFAFIQSIPHVQPPVLIGDFNAVPESLALLFLTGGISVNAQRGNLTEVWSALYPGDPGPTFATANAHGEPLDRRLDHVLVGVGSAAEPEGGRFVEAHRVLDQADPNGVFPSDHLGVSATLRFDGEPPPAAHGGGGCAVGRAPADVRAAGLLFTACAGAVLLRRALRRRDRVV